MAAELKNCELNQNFLWTLTAEELNEIAANMSETYGVTMTSEEVVSELTDDEAENILDYLTNQTRLKYCIKYLQYKQKQLQLS